MPVLPDHARRRREDEEPRGHPSIRHRGTPRTVSLLSAAGRHGRRRERFFYRGRQRVARGDTHMLFPSYADPAALIGRLALGALFLAHGWPKIKDMRKPIGFVKGTGWPGGAMFAVLFTLLEVFGGLALRSEEHTSELQSLTNLVCRLLL